MSITRRSWIAALSGGLLHNILRGASPELEAAVLRRKATGIMIHSRRPIDLETPVGWLDSWITPIDRFYVRSHFYMPSIDDAWRCSVSGLVDRPFDLTLENIRSFDPVEIPVTVECAGNGRGFFEPKVLGTQWRRGAVGTARWRGVRLQEVLAKAAPRSGGRHVAFHGADDPIGKAGDFTRSVPMEKCLHPATLLAYEMNGRPLPPEHGYPLRLITPGWEGAACVKWLTKIVVQEDEFDGPFMKRAYRVPVREVEPGASVDPADTKVITSLNVKSLITHPLVGATVPSKPTTISGFAWAGVRQISRVEVSTDNGGTWRDADLGRADSPYAWRPFSYAWTPPGEGRYTLMARATDTEGNVQPFNPSWNPGGYLRNVVEPVEVMAGPAESRFLTSLPPGRGKDIYEQSCTACHDASPIFYQQHDREGWLREITKMQGMGTAISEENKRVLAEYLAEHFGL